MTLSSSDNQKKNLENIKKLTLGELSLLALVFFIL